MINRIRRIIGWVVVRCGDVGRGDLRYGAGVRYRRRGRLDGDGFVVAGLERGVVGFLRFPRRLLVDHPAVGVLVRGVRGFVVAHLVAAVGGAGGGQLERLDCVIEPSREEVRSLATKYSGGVLDVQVKRKQTTH